MYYRQVEVEGNTQLSFWREIKRSSDKFAEEKFVAGSSEEKPTERSFFENLGPRYKAHFVCFYSRESLF